MTKKTLVSALSLSIALLLAACGKQAPVLPDEAAPSSSSSEASSLATEGMNDSSSSVRVIDLRDSSSVSSSSEMSADELPIVTKDGAPAMDRTSSSGSSSAAVL